MHGKSLHRLALVVAVALVSAMILPGLALAKSGGSPAPAGLGALAVYPKDMYESDDTSATAKVLPETSVHTFHSGTDEDWFMISADETGTVFTMETQYISDPVSIWDTEMTIYEVDPMDSSGLSELWNQDDSNVWQAYGSTAFFHAPAPGTYYVKVEPLSDDNRGYYTTFVYEGIGRRIGGANRYETAAALSKTMFPESPNGSWGTDATPNGVLLVNGTAYADALSAGAWGAMQPDTDDDETYPLLLTTKDSMPTVTSTEIERLAVSQWWNGDEFTVYVVGGSEVVSDAQIATIKALPYVSDAVRVSGANRYATAAEVASMTLDIDTPDTVVLATGMGWADGVAAGPLCGAMGAPMLLTMKDMLPAATSEWILDHPSVTNVIVVGGESAVSQAVYDELAAAPYSLAVTRLSGDNRYETAQDVASYGTFFGYFDPSGFTLVTGEDFADGLAAGPFSMLDTYNGSYGPGPVLLTRNDVLSEATVDYCMDYASFDRPSYAIGSAATISDDVFQEFLDLHMLMD